MATKQNVTKALQALQHLPNCPITDINVKQIVGQYHLDLADIPDKILDAAVIHYRTGNNQFFPSSGQLRDKATDLLLIAMDLPTAYQAWAQVINAVRRFERVWCDEGAQLYNAAIQANGVSTEAAHLWWAHEDKCKECKRGGIMEVYDHPIVEEIVRQMGGRENILLGDPGVCRALFLKGYNELIKNKAKLATIAAPVKKTIRELQAIDQMQLLAGKMEK